MVIGNGLIASAFKEYAEDEKRIIFASGVSNSFEQSDVEFNREKELLEKILKENQKKIIVYFSSFPNNNPYQQKYINHKLLMESVVKSSKQNNYCIIKIPQVVGNTGNDNGLFNYLSRAIKNDETIKVYKYSYRSLLDVEDLKLIVDVLQKRWRDLNTCVPFAGIEKLYVEDIVKLVAKHLNKTPIIEFLPNDNYLLPEKTIAVNSIINILGIESNGYTERLIKKYMQ